MENKYNYSNLRLSKLTLISFIVILWVSLLTPLSFSQVQTEFELGSPYTDFSVDHLGNLYTMSGNSVLTKIVETSEFEVEEYFYSNRALGDITNFNVSNPLKIIVNHQDFSTLVLLDVTLRETAQIYLPDLQIYSNPVAYCLANDNTVWVYDDVNVRLIRINEQGEVLFESQNLIQDIGFSPDINSMQSSKTYVVAHDKERGFLVFDQFGAFIKQVRLPKANHYQLINDRIYYAKEQSIFSYTLQSFAEQKIADLPKDASKFIIQNQKLYFLNSIGVGEMLLSSSVK